MALGRTYSIALVGLNGYIVEVEADIGQPVSNKRHVTHSCRNCAVERQVLYSHRMSSEVGVSQPPPNEPTSGSRSDDRQKEPTWKQNLAVAVAGALAGALLTGIAAFLVAQEAGRHSLRTAEITGDYLLRNSENEFLREQQIAAYGDYIEDLLTLEEKYREAVEIIAPVAPGVPIDEKQASEEATKAAQRALELRGEFDVAMDGITQSKSVVDVVGLDSVKNAAKTAIECYGPLKGEIQNHLSAHLAKKPIPPMTQTYVQALNKMHDVGREPFTTEARKSLDVPDAISSSAKVSAWSQTRTQLSPGTSPATKCMT